MNSFRRDSWLKLVLPWPELWRLLRAWKPLIKMQRSFMHLVTLECRQKSFIFLVRLRRSRCGRDHHEKDCTFREANCHKCGKHGHIVPVCKSGHSGHIRYAPPFTSHGTSHRRKKPSPRQPTGTKWVEADSSDPPEEFSLFVLSDASTTKPITVELGFCGKQTHIELDTGATVSIIGKQLFDTLFPELQIHPSSVALKTYTGEPMEVLGEVTVSVTYHQQRAQELPLVIVRGTGPSLLGRNWLHHIKLDWGSIKAVLPPMRSLDGLLEKYQDIFKDELGTIEPYKVKVSSFQIHTIRLESEC